MNDVLIPHYDELEKLYRNVLLQAMKDIGYGSPVDKQKVESWTYRDTFKTCCELANWDDAWIKDIFYSLDDLPDTIRKPITAQLIDIMYGIIRITGGSNERAAAAGGGGCQFTDDQGGVLSTHPSRPNSVLSAMSLGMHERKRKKAKD